VDVATLLQHVRIVSQNVFKGPDDALMSRKLRSRWLCPDELGGALLRVRIFLDDLGIPRSTLKVMERCGLTWKDMDVLGKYRAGGLRTCQNVVQTSSGCVSKFDYLQECHCFLLVHLDVYSCHSRNGVLCSFGGWCSLQVDGATRLRNVRIV
jgi:hypothetical protein